MKNLVKISLLIVLFLFVGNIAYSASCISSGSQLDKGKKDEDDYSCKCIKSGTECNLNKDEIIFE
jgi:hypothetical protein